MREYNMIYEKNEIIKKLLQNNFQLISLDNGVNEYRKNEISFYFVKNDIIIEYNIDKYFHVYQQLNYDVLFGIFHFCKLDDISRNELIKTFTPKNFVSKIRANYVISYKRKISND